MRCVTGAMQVRVSGECVTIVSSLVCVCLLMVVVCEGRLFALSAAAAGGGVAVSPLLACLS